MTTALRPLSSRLPSAGWSKPGHVPQELWDRHKAYHCLLDALARGLITEEYPSQVRASLQSAPGFASTCGLDLDATVHALASLKAQGIVEQELDRGFRWVPWQAEKLIEDLGRRHYLETLAVRILAERGPEQPLPLVHDLEEDLAHQEKLVEEMYSDFSWDSRDAFRCADAYFHADLAFAADLDIAGEL